jgi:hypothetical protein
MGTDASTAFAAYPGIERLQKYSTKSKHESFVIESPVPKQGKDKGFDYPAFQLDYRRSASREAREAGNYSRFMRAASRRLH